MNPVNFVIVICSLVVAWPVAAAPEFIGTGYEYQASQPQAQLQAQPQPPQAQASQSSTPPEAPSADYLFAKNAGGSSGGVANEAKANMADINKFIGQDFKGDSPARNVTFSFLRQDICADKDFVATLLKTAQEVEAELAAQAPNEPNPQNPEDDSTAYDPRWKIIDLLNCPKAIELIATGLRLENSAPIPEIIIQELGNLKSRLHKGSLQIDRDESLIRCTKKILGFIENGSSEQIECGAADGLCTADHLNSLKGRVYSDKDCSVYYMRPQIEALFATVTMSMDARTGTIQKTDLVTMLKGILFRSVNLMETIEKDSGKPREIRKVRARTQLSEFLNPNPRNTSAGV